MTYWLNLRYLPDDNSGISCSCYQTIFIGIYSKCPHFILVLIVRFCTFITPNGPYFQEAIRSTEKIKLTSFISLRNTAYNCLNKDKKTLHLNLKLYEKVTLILIACLCSRTVFSARNSRDLQMSANVKVIVNH